MKETNERDISLKVNPHNQPLQLLHHKELSLNFLENTFHSFFVDSTTAWNMGHHHLK